MVHKSFALSIGHAIGVSFISKEWFYKGAKKAYVSNPYQIRIQITIVATLSGQGGLFSHTSLYLLLF